MAGSTSLRRLLQSMSGSDMPSGPCRWDADTPHLTGNALRRPRAARCAGQAPGPHSGDRLGWSRFPLSGLDDVRHAPEDDVLQERLLHVHSVLGLLEDSRLRSLENL